MNFSQKLLLKKQGANNNSIPYLYLTPKKQPLNLMQDRYQNWCCVLDPAIALSHHGVTIAENMGKEIELWVVRELWNIINNAEFYARRTELITPEAVSTRHIAAETIWSLKEWSKTKQEKDLARLGVYWLGDNLQESFLPHNKPVEFFKQWEDLATALDKRNKSISNDGEILTSAVRDTIALAGSLRSAFILTYQRATEFDRGFDLPICERLKTWGISCEAIERHHPIVAMEREYILQLIVRAGLGKLILAGVHLAAFHLTIPANTATDTPHNNLQLPIEQNSAENYTQESYFWNKVKGFWYYL